MNCVTHLKIAHYVTHCAVLLKSKLEGAEVEIVESVHEFLVPYLVVRKGNGSVVLAAGNRKLLRVFSNRPSAIRC